MTVREKVEELLVGTRQVYATMDDHYRGAPDKRARTNVRHVIRNLERLVARLDGRPADPSQGTMGESAELQNDDTTPIGELELIECAQTIG